MNRKNDTIKWIAVVLVIAILGVAVAAALTQGFTNANPYGWLDKKEQPKEEAPAEENEVEAHVSLLSISNFQEFGILLEEAEATTASDDGDSAFEKTLTATVIPADAENKLVDWSVAWGDNASRANQNVNTYVTVTPTSDGSNVAKVKCLKAFTGDYVFVTVTTRVGGYQAYCTVQYVGIPQRFAIDTSGKTVRTDSAWNKSMVELDCGGVFYFNLNLDNDLHSVGSEYGQYTISVVPYGSVETEVQVHTNSTGQDTYSTQTYQHHISTAYQTGENEVITALGVNDNIIYAQISISDGKLLVQTRVSPSSINSQTGGPGGWRKETFKRYVDNKPCYVAITVTDTVSGLSNTINVKTVPTVTSVSMNPTSITF